MEHEYIKRVDILRWKRLINDLGCVEMEFVKDLPELQLTHNKSDKVGKNTPTSRCIVLQS